MEGWIGTPRKLLASCLFLIGLKVTGFLIGQVLLGNCSGISHLTGSEIVFFFFFKLDVECSEIARKFPV